jgi:DNA polymerase-3 subunit gamma/tau
LSNKQEKSSGSYLALARKYRSRHFGELVGQDVLVRTLSNAIHHNRIHHAYMLTGVRGVGKTSTARIMAKAINYTGPDGTSGPTTGPTDDCRICQAITEDRHPDVIELDAASHTGIDDIKELLEGVRYAPVEARYKVYIIDEVHMLSKSAFNALLKTLEEPPPHTVFIFATTEIRKVPVTILSRCQRFDLRRIDVETLSKHFSSLLEKEGVTIDADALEAVSQAADGSARDGLSLLDQAIARASGEKITLELVRSMLGQADQDAIVRLLMHIWNGEAADALQSVQAFYTNGADPAMVAQDILGLLHACSVSLALPNQTKRLGLQDATREKLDEKLHILGIGTLSHQWQIALKGLQDVQTAPQPQAALDMMLLRLIYAAAMPPLDQLLKKTPSSAVPTMKDTPRGGGSNGGSGGAPKAHLTSVSSSAAVAHAVARPMMQEQVNAQPDVAVASVAQNAEQQDDQQNATFSDLKDIVALCEQHGEILLAADLSSQVRLVKMTGQAIEIVLLAGAGKDLPQKLRQKLLDWTGQRWLISVATQGGQATLREQADVARAQAIAHVEDYPEIQRLRQTLPAFTITNVTHLEDDES